ncbi:hypothetical protein DINM_007212 [Dirofilaria immitis]|nr:hypothetical protein [Dirofilaria immitis]
MIVCFRSLKQAYRVRKASSPYSTLIEGHYDAFYIKPRIVRIQKNNSKYRNMASDDQKVTYIHKCYYLSLDSDLNISSTLLYDCYWILHGYFIVNSLQNHDLWFVFDVDHRGFSSHDLSISSSLSYDCRRIRTWFFIAIPCKYHDLSLDCDMDILPDNMSCIMVSVTRAAATLLLMFHVSWASRLRD